MIISKLQGGLGNQLFQWAAAKNLSIKYDCDLFFDKAYFSSHSNGVVTKWDYEMGHFNNIDIKESRLDGNPLNHIYDNFTFQNIPSNSYLDGYWQSEKYFIVNQQIIRDLLKIPQNTKEYILKKYPILNSNTVSLHIRRGDYVNLQGIYPLQTKEYYDNCLSKLCEKDINIIILSNDIDWCINNLSYNNVTYIKNETNIIDLYIMSLCNHNIIANSTFSWWGAWLNENKYKKIFAPKKWFVSTYSDQDIIPNNWIKI